MTPWLIGLRDEDLAPRARPSSRWRNRWRAYGFGAVVCSVCETYTFYEPGAEFENHCRTFPCQDTALAWAADNPLKGTAHLGAFPIEADA